MFDRFVMIEIKWIIMQLGLYYMGRIKTDNTKKVFSAEQNFCDEN